MNPKDQGEVRQFSSEFTCFIASLWSKAEEIVGFGINRKLSSFLISIILIFAILFMIILLIYLPRCIMEISIIIQPFEVGNGIPQDFSGDSLANSLCFELTRIEGMERGPRPLPPFNKLPGSTDEKYPPQKHDFHTIEFKDNNIYEVGKLEVSGVSVSLGHIIPFLKKLFHKQGSIITGSFQRYGSTLYIVANFYNPDSHGEKNKAYGIKRTLANNETAFEVLPFMIEDLAYKIKLGLLRDEDKTTSDNYPETWEAFKNYTLAWEEYHVSNITRNDKYLESAGNKALLVKNSEPNFTGSDDLLFSIAYTWNDKGVDLAQHGRYDEALNAFEKAIKLGPNYVDIWNNKGIVFKSQHKYNEAFEAFNTAINLSIISPSSIEMAATWKNKGWMLKDMDRKNEAIDAFDVAIRFKPDYAEACVGKGWTLKDMDRQNEAIDAFDKAIRLKPDYAEAWNSKGWTFKNMTEYDNALQAFERAIEMKPTYANAWLGKGQVLNITGKYTEAIQAYNAVIWLFEVRSCPDLNYDETPDELKSDYIEALNDKRNVSQGAW